jgi:predicted phosphodiesterase
MLMNNALKAKGDTAVATRILSVSDTHVPFELPIETLSAYKGRVDILQLNGDICDCQAISKFNKVYRVSPMEEIIKARKYVIDMIEYLQPKKVVVTYGNHDLRFQNYIAKNLDNEMAELMPRTSLELIFVDGFFHYDKREGTKSWYTPIKELFPAIEIDYTDNWWTQIGDTIFAHPSAFSSGVLKTAERAMHFFRNEGMQFLELVMAHTHRVGEYYIGNTRIIEQGAFSDVSKNNYNNGQLYNSQKEGFVYLCQDINGKTIREKTELVALN